MSDKLPTYQAIIERLDRIACENPSASLSHLFIDAAGDFQKEGYYCTSQDLIDVVTRKALNDLKGEAK